MKELTFECPSCGQQIQCGAQHAGENFPCPNCATLVRIPGNPESAANPDENQGPDNPDPSRSTESAADENPFETETVAASYTPIKSNKNAGAPIETPNTSSGESASDADNQTPFSANDSTPRDSEPNSKPPIIVTAQITEMVCVCPVCQSELRIKTNAAAIPSDIAQAKEVNSEAPEKSVPASQPKTLPDREQQIAAGREATPIQARPIVKPRLSYILTGGERPVTSENQAAQQPSKPPPLPTKSLSE
jgi:hypothetical protein